MLLQLNTCWLWEQYIFQLAIKGVYWENKLHWHTKRFWYNLLSLGLITSNSETILIEFDVVNNWNDIILQFFVIKDNSTLTIGQLIIII